MLPHGCYLSLSLSRALSLMHICINKNISILKIDIYMYLFIHIYMCVCFMQSMHSFLHTYLCTCMHACILNYSHIHKYMHTHTLTCVIRPANRRGQNSASGLNKGFSVPHPFAFEHAHVEQGRPEIRICSCCIHTLREFECSGHVGCSASC